ncbi:hypothetical protein [Streptomyces specialis]|uniref:hypothetical protein n=1 Tax=Streptomyces specialis TaxID=498367 RepID=UPI00073E7702|nr:hypothetical protein [Streptomyces specialis]
MAWEWRFEKADGSAAEPSQAPGDFGTQGDAESWIGEAWPELLAEGIEAASLLEDGAKVYGPMSLRTAEE